MFSVFMFLTRGNEKDLHSAVFCWQMRSNSKYKIKAVLHCEQEIVSMNILNHTGIKHYLRIVFSNNETLSCISAVILFKPIKST